MHFFIFLGSDIAFLQGKEKEVKKTWRKDLVRRIKMLEYALKQEGRCPLFSCMNKIKVEQYYSHIILQLLKTVWKIQDLPKNKGWYFDLILIWQEKD